MSNKKIQKITLAVNVEGEDQPRLASLAFGGFEPHEHDVLRLFGVLKQQVDELDADATEEKK